MNGQNVVSVRLRPSDAALISAAAEREGVAPSTYLRNLALREELRSRPGTQARHLPNGAELLLWTNAPELLSA